MGIESRTRILILLPIPKTLPQFFDVLNVLDELEQVAGGATRTDYYVPEVWGQWFDMAQGERVEDDLLLIIADHPSSVTDPHITSHLEQIKLDAQIALGEDIVWITIHGVMRIAAHDYVK
jgi:hypothetical protein